MYEKRVEGYISDHGNGGAVFSNHIVCRLLMLMTLEKLFDAFYGFLKLVFLLCACFVSTILNI